MVKTSLAGEKSAAARSREFASAASGLVGRWMSSWDTAPADEVALKDENAASIVVG
jgi:hypothetical protein